VGRRQARGQTAGEQGETHDKAKVGTTRLGGFHVIHFEFLMACL
jgi:hypothetical protein